MYEILSIEDIDFHQVPWDQISLVGLLMLGKKLKYFKRKNHIIFTDYIPLDYYGFLSILKNHAWHRITDYFPQMLK